MLAGGTITALHCGGCRVQPSTNKIKLPVPSLTAGAILFQLNLR